MRIRKAFCPPLLFALSLLIDLTSPHYPSPFPPQNQPYLPSNSTPTCFLGNTPVCSTMNITFPNTCVMLLLGQNKKSEGWCPSEPVTSVKIGSYKTPNNGYLSAVQHADPNSPCPCNSCYNPVCGNNSVTYASRCRMECANVKMSQEGPCGYFNWAESPHFNCPCGFNFEPSCGADGSTYENECTMNCGHQALRSKGACRMPCNCTNIYKPVCSKKHKTFRNQCLLKCEKQEFYKKGKCPERKPARCSHCEGLKSPACAIDGLTYENRCYLKCAGGQFYSKGICPNDEAYEGLKGKDKLPNCGSCRRVMLPVCGQDETTYKNACLARCKGMGIKYKGKCLKGNENVNKCGCDMTIMKPVCGTDKRTYQNKCEAKCQQIGKYL